MNICDFVQIGGGQDDLVLSIERRVGRMPVSSVRITEIGGAPHLTWLAMDGEEEGISLRANPDLAAQVQASNGAVLVEYAEDGLIESSAQVVRAEHGHTNRERFNG